MTRRKNRTNQVSRQCLYEALVSLMQDHTFHEISITDITSTADVSRMAYYRNYETKEQILAERLDEIGTEIRKLLLGYNDAETVRIFFRLWMEHLGTRGEHIPCNLGLAILNTGMINFFTDNFAHQIALCFPGLAVTRNAYRINAYVGAFFACFLEWSRNGRKESPDELSKACFDILSSDIRAIL